MATVQVFTAARMQEIEDNTVVGGLVVGDDLILTRNDATTVNAGNVRGPIGPLGPSVEPGVSAIWFFSTIPTGWLALEGQVITGANTLYPGLWAAADAGWKSGTTLTLPNMKGKFAVHIDPSQTEFDTMGETGGSKTRTLALNNIPKHVHGMNHAHGSATVSLSTDTHGHDVTRPDGTGGEVQWAGAASDTNLYGVGNYGSSSSRLKTTNYGHTHTGSAAIPAYTGNTEDGTAAGLGSTPFSLLPPYIVVRFIIKT